jgi:DNA-directed RNA polymerase subunit H (RpoH/RPB5)
MFIQRGYTDMTHPQKTKLGKLNVLLIHAIYLNRRSNIKERIHCLFVPFNHVKLNSAIGKNEVQDYCNTLLPDDHVIFIADAVSFQSIDFMNSKEFYWEILSYSDTCCDKMEHIRVPSYRVLCEKEILQIEELYGPRQTFPKMISRVDAIARFMDFRIDDVLEIKRRSSIGGSVVSYRLVTHADDLI